MTAADPSPQSRSTKVRELVRNSALMLCTGVAGTVLAWALGIMLALLVSVALHRVELDASGWRTLSVSPTAGVYLIAIVLSLLVWLALASRPWATKAPDGPTVWQSVLRPLPISVAFGFAVGLLAGAIVLTFAPAPISFSVDERRIIPVFPETEGEPLIAYSVFFANGSALLSREQQGALRAFLAPLGQCQGVDVVASGQTSSARYRTDNEARNLKLSSDRVDSVTMFAKTEGVKVQTAPPWHDFSAMTAARLMDDGDGSKPSPYRESFNRQVSLRVRALGTCGFTNAGKSR